MGKESSDTQNARDKMFEQWRRRGRLSPAELVNELLREPAGERPSRRPRVIGDDNVPRSPARTAKGKNPWNGPGRKPDKKELLKMGPILTPYLTGNLSGDQLLEICEEFDRKGVAAPAGEGWDRSMPRQVWANTQDQRNGLVTKAITHRIKIVEAWLPWTTPGESNSGKPSNSG